MDQQGSILLTEDEVLIQQVVADGLRDAGFEVATATDGAEAIQMLEASPDLYRALVTDVQLGDGLNGWDLARRARELVGDMPVVYVTADSGGEWASQGVPNSILINKPFANAQLVTAVAGLLNDIEADRAG